MTDAAAAVRRAGVLVASTSAAAGTNPDRTGPVISQWLQQRGFTVDLRITADGPEVGVGLRQLLAGEPRLILTTGGTGVSPTDLTPEQTAPLLEVQLPGVIEAIRRRGEAVTPLSVLTRGVAGFAGSCLIVNLPGSAGGVRDGLAVLDSLLEHLLEQRITGGGHGPRH